MQQEHDTAAVPPPGRARRRTADAIRRLILDAARDTFQRLGYDGATTAGIAAAANVTQAQLFRCFDSKAALFRAAVIEPLDRSFAEFNARELDPAGLVGDWRAEAQRYMSDLQLFIDAQARMLKTLVVADAYGAQGDRGVASIGGLAAYFDIGADTMRSHAGTAQRVDPQLMVRVAFAAVLGSVLFKDWLFPAGLAGERDVAAALTAFVLDGISVNRPDAEV